MSASSNDEELARRASFIFKGTVQKLKAATMPSVPVSDRTAIVRVDHVIEAPRMLSGYEGRDITVQLSKGEKVKKGEQAVFYANGWLFGESVAVESVGHTAVEKYATRAASVGDPTELKKGHDLQ